MTALFGIPLLIGFVLMIAWVAFAALADTVDGWSNADPERRFGSKARLGLSAFLGFGMAGISALYAGWPNLLSVVAGIGGAILLGIASHRFGPEGD